MLAGLESSCAHLQSGERGGRGFDGGDEQIPVHRSLIERGRAPEHGRGSVLCNDAKNARQLLALLHADVPHAQDVVCSGNKESDTRHAQDKRCSTDSRLVALHGWAPYEVPDVQMTRTLQ